MAIRTINHPGVEIIERDLSQVASTLVGTVVMITGYTQKGPVKTPLVVSTEQSYLDIFGTPESEAEYYHYLAVKETIDNLGTALVCKLPYNNLSDQNYRATLLKFSASALVSGLSTSDDEGYAKEAGTQFDFTNAFELTYETDYIPTSAYQALETTGEFTAVASIADYQDKHFAIVDNYKSVVGGEDGEDGLFTVIVDPVKALMVQRLLTDTSGDDPMNILNIINTTTVAGSVTTETAIDDWLEPLSGVVSGTSFSEDVVSQYPVFETTVDNNEVVLSKDKSLHIGVIVCRTFTNENTNGKPSISIAEAHVGSVLKERDKVTGQSNYICDAVNANSNYIQMYRNESATPVAGLPSSKITDLIYTTTNEHTLMSFGSGADTKLIEGGVMVTELDNIYSQLSDIDKQQIDVYLDAGLSSIAQFTDDNAGTGTIYDPIHDTDTNDVTITSLTQIATWVATVNAINGFCKNTRRDCISVVDAPRHFALRGDAKVVRATNPDVNFDNTLAKRVPLISAVMNNSFEAPYVSWLRTTNKFTGALLWVPNSCYMGGLYCNVDFNYNYWDAPYGLERGLLNNVVDTSFSVTPKQEDFLYNNNLNYVKNFPIEGFVVWGQKTGQKQKTAYDRINVRRMVLRLERYVYQACRGFVGKVNNTFTRRQLLSIIEPEFKRVKASGGLYDYLLVCDTSNNTSDVIDLNELKLGVYIQPVKVADFIRATFFTTRTGVNFEEIIGTI